MYKSPYIEMNEHGIDLVRNYRTYKHIEFSEIKSVYCKKGHLIRNWGLSLVMGIGLVIFCLRWGITSALAFNPLDIPFYATRAFIAYHIIIPWLLLTGGAFLIVQALRKSPVIVMNTNEGFIDFLAERTKVEIEESLREKGRYRVHRLMNRKTVVPLKKVSRDKVEYEEQKKVGE